MSQFDSIRFQPSRPLLKEVTADRLNTILSEIRRNKPRGERGITVRQTGDATYIGLAASFEQKATRTISHPFQVVTKTEGDSENATYFWGVVADSYVFNGFQFASQPVGLLGQEQQSQDENWLAIDTGDGVDYIYLELDVAEGTVSIKSTGSGGNLNLNAGANEEGGLIEVDFEQLVPMFKFARKIIAVATPGDSNAPTITQGITMNQLLQDVVYGGVAIRYFFDFSAGRQVFPS